LIFDGYCSASPGRYLHISSPPCSLVMARDRLAAMRAQRQAGQAGPPGSPQQGGQYEMSSLQTPTFTSNGNSEGTGLRADPISGFFNEVSSIQDSLRQLDANVSRISDLHGRSLNNTDDAVAKQSEAALDELVSETRSLSNQIKNRIKDLEKEPIPPGENVNIRQNQMRLLREKFVEGLQSYQRVEQEYRQKYRQRVERQFKIVKPDATSEEIKAVVDNDDGTQVFSQALMSSTRYGESRAAYREVQERHEEIQKIERNLAELAQLFTDMSELVTQQGETIDAVETTAAQVQGDTEAGLQHTEKAVVSARKARRKRWICFFLLLIILAIIGIVVGVVVSQNVKK